MTLAVAATAVAIGAVAQSVSGIGLVLVCGPFLVAVLGPADGVAAAVTLSLVLNAVILAREWRQVRWGRALLLLVPAALATPVWFALVRRMPERGAAAVAGVVTMLGVALIASGRRAPAARGAGGAVVAGVASAGMNAAAAIGGPAAVLYADNAGWSPLATRATLQAYFLGLNVVSAVTLRASLPPLALLLALAVGLAAGAGLAGRVPEAAARRTTLVLSAAGAAAVLVRAALGSA